MSRRGRAPRAEGRIVLQDGLVAAAAGFFLWTGAVGFANSLSAQNDDVEERKPVLSAAVEQKLDQVATNDAMIEDRFDALSQEMSAVKTRVLRSPQTP
jgi:hypothetical protein